MISHLTTVQAAERLGIPRRQVYTLIAQGRLEGVKLLGEGPRSPLFFDPVDVDRVAAELAEQGAA